MKNTFISRPSNSALSYATGTFKGEYVPTWKFTEITAGCGALKSTARDMIKYLAFQINGPDAKRASLYLAAQKSHVCTDIQVGPNIFMCLGWHILKIKKIQNSKPGIEKIVWHNGQTYGFRSFAGFVKKDKMGVVILCNSGSVDINSLGFSILAEKIR